MFLAIFDKEYRAAKARYNEAKSKIKDLENVKCDITNDTACITAINTKMDSVYNDFASAVMDTDVRIRILTKLEELKEQYQNVDGNLTAACGEIDADISRLRREMAEAEAEMEAIERESNEGR